jgi:hypothetical protein
MKKLLILPILFCILAGAAQAYITYPAYKKVPQKLNVSFRTAPYTLIIKNDVKNPYKENRLPRVFAVRGKKEVKILRPMDLLSIIPPLRSKSEVMAFIRLFTDCNTHGLFMSPGALEVFVADTKTIPLLNDDNYGWGLIHPDRAKEVGVNTVSIKKGKNGYVVTRTLVFYPQAQKNLRMVEVSELLLPNSRAYALTESRSISDAPWVERLLTPRK